MIGGKASRKVAVLHLYRPLILAIRQEEPCWDGINREQATLLIIPDYPPSRSPDAGPLEAMPMLPIAEDVHDIAVLSSHASIEECRTCQR